MGTKVHCESYLPGYYSMRDPNEGSSGCNWPMIYGDKSLGNGPYSNGYLGRAPSNSYSGESQDAIKQKMLEHEAVFRHQVFELHRLYKIQKDLMDEIKRKELHKHNILIETSASSSPLISQKSNIPYFYSNPVLKINSPSMSSARGNINQDDRFLLQNGGSSNDCEILEVRPSKVRKKLFDLQRPGDEYIDPEEDEQAHHMIDLNTRRELKVECNGDTHVSSSHLRNRSMLADLNEPIQVEEATHPPAADSSNSSFLLGLSKEVFENPQNKNGNRVPNGIHMENKGDWRGRPSYTYEGQNKINLNFIPQGPQQDHYTTLGNVHHPRSSLGSAHGSGDIWREKERTVHNLRISETSNLYHQKPVGTLTQRLSSTQAHPPLNSFGTSNTSSQSQEMLNRVHPGPPPPWIKVASERSINYSPSIRATEMNLNLHPSKHSCTEIVDVEKECEDQARVLPWLEKTETLKGPDQVSSQQISEKRLSGLPIFDKSYSATKKDSSSLGSTSTSLKEKGKSVMIDINIACDIDCSTEVAEQKPLIREEIASSRALFDLNSCVSEDETTLVPSLASTNASTRRIVIDLEAPPVPESDEDGLSLIEQPQDEVILTAAEAIFTLSSLTTKPPSENPPEDPLLWFVETVCDFEKSRTFRNELDEFEALTQSLRELEEEEYMPEPLVPEFTEIEENGGFENVRNRNRRGVARRGTRKRDFQRDILPGLMSLSRHEVSEDIQTFGGLMKATGHVWSSGLTKRNGSRGGGRGRRRVAVAPPPVDDVAETATACPSLTEAVNIWGSTPRRPRRQRGAPGNPPSGSADP